MITCYFGVPGCGKTTRLVQIAKQEQHKLKKIYDHIYTINFECDGCILIDYDDLKNYKMKNSLILIDEITMNADNRGFKTFTKDERDFFILHRHLGVDIIYATQNYENVDKKIRDLTQELWYMSKSVIPLFRQFTTSKRIYRNININEHTSELTMGYRFCNILESFFTSNFKITYRKHYYKYFDSFDQLSLESRPLLDKSNVSKINSSNVVKLLNRMERFKWRNKKKVE